MSSDPLKVVIQSWTGR